MRFLFIVIALCIFSNLHAQKNFRAFIPEGYDTLYGGYAEGDLNKDGIPDLALALFHKNEKEKDSEGDEDSAHPRLLLVLFGSRTGYTPAVQSAKAIKCVHCGGVFGDPFFGIFIQNGTFGLSHYGGSAWKWSSTHRFRFQDHGWYLIGQTSISWWSIAQCDKLDDFAGLDLEDVNYVTGQFETKKISQDCKLLEHKKGKRKVQPLLSLTEFNIDN